MNKKNHIYLPLLILISYFHNMGHSQAQPNQELSRYFFQERHMGTIFKIIIYAPNNSVANLASDAAFDKVEQLNQVMSNYVADSEINLLSASSGTGQKMKVSAPLFEIIQQSQYYAKLSQGAFDITVGPLIDLWRQSRRNEAMPQPDSLTQALAATGYQHLKLYPRKSRIKLKNPGMLLDLGGIGKGYAADQMLEVLKSYGLECSLIDAGGDLVLGAPPPGANGWKVQIGLFEQDKPQYSTLVELAHQAIAASGDLYRFVEIDGIRYSHIIDPETGLGLTDQSRVTVIAPDGTAADALASAVSVSGPEKGLQLIKDLPDTEALYFQMKQEKVLMWQTKAYLDPALETQIK